MPGYRAPPTHGSSAARCSARTCSSGFISSRAGNSSVTLHECAAQPFLKLAELKLQYG